MRFQQPWLAASISNLTSMGHAYIQKVCHYQRERERQDGPKIDTP